jgi:flagellar protein FlbT
MPLILSLKPNEKFVLNGAVIQNGDRRATLVVQNQAAILREKEILQAEDVTTPARRIYFPIMMMYLDPERSETHYEDFVVRMTEFMNAVANPEALATCVAVSKEVMRGAHYKALIHAKKLFAYEEARLNHVPAGLPEDAESLQQSAGY